MTIHRPELFTTHNIWDPSDDEWPDVDASSVVDTFRASFKDPARYSPRKASALTRFGSSISSTLTSLVTLRSRTGKAAQEMRDEEARRDKLEMLGNTYYCNPEGDVNDEVMETTFVAGSKYFLTLLARSPRHMHIIDMFEYFESHDAVLHRATPRLCDAVATILSHASRECLEAFLDPSIEEFAYHRELDRNKAGLILVIRRNGNKVVAGAYRNFGFSLQWTLYVQSLIGATGLWHEVYATLKAGQTHIIDGVPQWNTFEPEVMQGEVESGGLNQNAGKKVEQSPRKLVLASPKKKDAVADISPTNPKFMLYESRLLARYLLWDIWVRFDKLCECRATWEADGDVKDVRLQRTLVGFDDEEDMEE